MKIKILGTRGEIKISAPHYLNHSGILLDGKIMLDLGEEEFLKENPQAIFITHLHPDHAFFIEEKVIFSSPIPIFAPEKNLYCPDIRVISKTQAVGAYQITPIPTLHSKRVKSQAYLIQKGNQKILYTGDLIWIEKKYHPYLKNLDLVITEASFLKKGGMVRRDKKTGEIFGHNGAPDLIHFFKRFTSRIIFVHFGSWFYQDIRKAKKELERLGANAGIKVEVGEDGKEIKA